MDDIADSYKNLGQLWQVGRYIEDHDYVRQKYTWVLTSARYEYKIVLRYLTDPDKCQI